MTAPPQARQLDRTTPTGARTTRGVAGGPSGRWSLTSTLAVAVIAWLVPEIAMWVVDGAPATAPEWVARSVPAAVGLAVVVTRVRVELAATILIVSVLTVFPSADVALDSPGVWPSVAAIALFAGVCWVTCSLGFLLPLRWSCAWMAGLGVATVWALTFDVPVTMLGVGWWLVGVTFRHHEQVSNRLRERADELTAEQERFAGEAVRLERARIARELHDVVAHCMTVIVIQARAGQQLTEMDPGGATQALDAILATAREAEQDLDALVGLVDPERTRPSTRSADRDRPPTRHRRYARRPVRRWAIWRRSIRSRPPWSTGSSRRRSRTPCDMLRGRTPPFSWTAGTPSSDGRERTAGEPGRGSRRGLGPWPVGHRRTRHRPRRHRPVGADVLAWVAAGGRAARGRAAGGG